VAGSAKGGFICGIVKLQEAHDCIFLAVFVRKNAKATLQDDFKPKESHYSCSESDATLRQS
jgi:hypothetical protein